MSKPREFLYFFAAQFLNFALVTWNIRSLAMGWWVSMVASDILISLLGFTLVKKIAEAKSKTAMFGYAIRRRARIASRGVHYEKGNLGSSMSTI